MSSTKFNIADTKENNPEETTKYTESVALGLADGYAFNYLEIMNETLDAQNNFITVLLPKIKGDDVANSWVKNGNATIKDLISTMKQDGPGKLLNDNEISFNQDGVGCPTVDSFHKGGSLIDIPNTLSVIIRGIRESAAQGDDFDMMRYNSEIDIFGNRLAMRMKEGGYVDVVTVVKLEFSNIKEIDRDAMAK
jgi:hypothetical protein